MRVTGQLDALGTPWTGSWVGLGAVLGAVKKRACLYRESNPDSSIRRVLEELAVTQLSKKFLSQLNTVHPPVYFPKILFNEIDVFWSVPSASLVYTGFSH